jgi:branched-chain amino acid transport system permease protein
MISSYMQGVIILVCINIIAVTGVSILTGFASLFSFGNAGFMAVGAYVSAIASVQFQFPFLLSLIGGVLVAGVLSLGLGKLTLRLRGDYFLIVTLGFGEVVRVLIEFFDRVTGGARGFAGIPLKTTFWVAVAFAIGSVVVATNIIHSKFGRNLMAIREQEVAAEAVGVDTTRFKQMAFTLSAAFAGLAGGLFAHYYMYITPKMFALEKSAEFTITVVVGGLGSLSGSILASIMLTLLPEVFRFLANYRMLFYGLSVLLIVLLKPSGLMGYKEFSLTWIGKVIKARRRRITEAKART